MTIQKIKILVILGPTASGKSGLAIEFAKKYNGEVVSADSRQVYRGLDIGTGKVTKAEMAGIPHHCLDIADPKERFTVMDWKHCAEEAIAGIVSRGKLPIICGGTGFYISTLLENIEYPDIEINEEERRRLESLSADELFAELEKLDPNRASNIDRNNKRRLMRSILIARNLGHVPKINNLENKYDAMKIGIKIDDNILKEKINKRLIERIDAGMIEEARKLHADGLTFDRMNELGLEYKYLAQFLQGQINQEQMINILKTKIWQYARRQKTWWRKDKDIVWVPSSEVALRKSHLGRIGQYLG